MKTSKHNPGQMRQRWALPTLIFEIVLASTAAIIATDRIYDKVSSIFSILSMVSGFMMFVLVHRISDKCKSAVLQVSPISRLK